MLTTRATPHSNQYPKLFFRRPRRSDVCCGCSAEWEILPASMHTVLDGSLFRVFEILNMATESAFSVGFMRSTELWILNGTLSSRALLAVVLDAAFGWHCRMPAAEQKLLRPPWLFLMSSSGAFLFLVIWYVWLFCAEKIIDSWTNWPASVWRCCLADSARSRS